MHPAVEQMAEFYEQPLGHHTAHVVRGVIRRLWPDCRGDRLLAYGYAGPYLRMLGRQADCIMAMQAAQMGARAWPRDEANLVALVEPRMMPLSDNSVDRIFLIHALEYLGGAGPALAEFYRLLAPGGRLLAVVPNRRGLWSMTDNTPFGFGEPFSRGQIVALLRAAGFQCGEVRRALCFPPARGRKTLATLRPVERAGRVLWPGLSGVLVVEGRKEIFAGIARREKAVSRAEVEAGVPGLVVR